MSVSPEKFVEVWQTSNSAYQVCERLDMKYPAVIRRVTYYRKKGIPLKKFGGNKLDIDNLIKLAEESIKQKEE